MLSLILLWALIGLCLGLLTLLAHPYPTVRYSWLILPVTGIGIAILTGFVGILLLGKDVATPLALWITIAGLLGTQKFWTRFF